MIDSHTPDRVAFLTEEPVVAGSHVSLSDGDARHVQVLRLGVGERVGLRDGAGMVASGVLVRLARAQALVEVDQVRLVDPPSAIHLIVPIADRDRMLWLAEKATELNVASWRPVLWQRSKSVSPRGDGAAFRAKVRLRTISALLQSRSAWLPEIYPDAQPDRAIATAAPGTRLVLDVDGAPVACFASAMAVAPVTIAIGPEGGFDEAELAALEAAGFARASLGDTVLRFETAGIAAIAVARSMLTISPVINSVTICPVSVDAERLRLL